MLYEVITGAFSGGHDDLAVARHIDIGTGCQRLAPEAHGASRVQPLGGTEAAYRFGMIEGERQHQALVEA